MATTAEKAAELLAAAKAVAAVATTIGRLEDSLTAAKAEGANARARLHAAEAALTNGDGDDS